MHLVNSPKHFNCMYNTTTLIVLFNYIAFCHSFTCMCFLPTSDPYNRQPLTMKMIEPLPELKKQIEDWVKTKVSESVAKAKAQSTSEGPVGKSEE